LQNIGGHAKENFRNAQIACRAYAYKHGIDSPEITGWRWPQQSARIESKG
jgi:xylulose-5-phosphate/fructose-6-phosphate phosphoketolase